MATMRKTIGTVFEWDITMIPAMIERRDSRPAGFFLLLFGIVFGGIPVGTTAWTLANGQFDPFMLWVVIPFGIIAVVVAGIGVNKLYYRLFMRIDSETVFVRLWSLLKHDEWREFLSRYRGVLLRTDWDAENPRHVIMLDHPDPARRVVLAEYLVNIIGEPEVRTRWESYARIINLPAIEDTGVGRSERKPGDIDRPLREVLRDSGDGVVPAVSAPRRVRIELNGDREAVVIGYKRSASWKTIIAVAIPAAIVYIGFFVPEAITVNFLVFGLFGALMGAWVIAFTAWDLIASPVIVTDARGIRVASRTPFGETTGKRADFSEIKEVLVGKAPNSPYPSVLIRTDRRTIAACPGLSDDVLAWVRDRIVGKVRGR